MNISDFEIERKIKNRLRQKGITFKDLAAKIEMTEAGLYRTLKNNTIKLDTVNKISSILGLPLTVLLDENLSAIVNEDINNYYHEVEELKKIMIEKQTLIEYLNQKDHANQEVLLSIINLLSALGNQPCSFALKEIKKLKKVEFLIEYGLINPDIFK